MRISAFLSMLALAMAAAPARACMWNEIYPVFWDKKPLFLRADEVVLKVEPAGHAGVKSKTGFTTSCDGAADVFKVVEVLHGKFEQSEIAIVYPIIGGAFDTPVSGEQRIIVGRVLPSVPLEDRHVDNGTELARELGPSLEGFGDRFVVERIGGPSTVPALEFRAPVELPVKMFFVAVVQSWPILPLGYQIALIAVPLAVLIGLAFLTHRIHRHLTRSRTRA